MDRRPSVRAPRAQRARGAADLRRRSVFVLTGERTTMKKKILIVDDSSTIRLQVTNVLTKAGFDVAQAEDGIEGADLIDRDEIALVLCDVNMPRMNGLSMLEHVKSQAR